MILTYASSIILCSLLGLIYYYATKTFPNNRLQKCHCSFIIYFTGAVSFSQVIGYFEQYMSSPPPVVKSLVYTIIQQSQQRSITFLQ
jgi:hypothetical protein